jgi:tetratricopeptide (TPR) repeat protein
MKRLFLTIALTLALALPLAAQPAGNYTGTAEIQSTAARQIAYARVLYSKALSQHSDGPARKQAFVDAVTALEAVPHKWPNDKAAVGQALLLEGQYFFGESAYPNVLRVLDRAATALTGSADEAWMWDLRGRALERLNRADDAEAAYVQAKKGLHRLDDGRQSAVLHDVALLHARRGKFEEASDEYREIARLRGPHAWSAVTPMMMSIDANLKLAGKERAKQDLRELETLIAKARVENLSPRDRQGLAEAEETLKHYRKKLGE